MTQAISVLHRKHDKKTLLIINLFIQEHFASPVWFLCICTPTPFLACSSYYYIANACAGTSSSIDNWQASNMNCTETLFYSFYPFSFMFSVMLRKTLLPQSDRKQNKTTEHEEFKKLLPRMHIKWATWLNLETGDNAWL